LLNKLAIKLPGFSLSTLAHISLILVGLMWVLPFLYYYHAYPITTFYHEWGAALLGLGASTFLLARQHWLQPKIPRIVLLPLGLMMLALLQFIVGKAVFFDQTLLFVLYMLWVALLMMLGRALRLQFGLAVMAAMLAAFLLLGAELSALAGILQHYRWHTFLDTVVTAKNGIAVYGNLAQPNHFANYIALGLISLGLLRTKLRAWQTVLLVLPLLFVLVLSGSRSSWMYLIGMLVLAYVWQRKDSSLKGLFHYTLLLLLGFGLMHFVVQLPWLSGSTGSVTTMQRMMAGDTNGSIRLYLWHEAWLIFSQYPLLGAGWGQFAWQHFQLGPMLHAHYITGLYNNAHNLLLQFAAEMGIAGVLVLLFTIAMWFWQSVRAMHFTSAHWWSYAVLMVLGIHSMLEYPLWYAYFIGVAAILLGALDDGSYRLELGRLGRLSVAAVLLLGGMTLALLMHNYRSLELVISPQPNSANDKNLAQNVRDRLIALQQAPLLRPYAELFMNNYIEISPKDLDSKMAFNERAVKFIPVSFVVYRNAELLALNNQPDEARLQMERAIWAYPADFPAQQANLEELARNDAEHYSALLEFAVQKYKEYSSAAVSVN
jgi:O-antigen ligase